MLKSLSARGLPRPRWSRSTSPARRLTPSRRCSSKRCCAPAPPQVQYQEAALWFFSGRRPQLTASTSRSTLLCQQLREHDGPQSTTPEDCLADSAWGALPQLAGDRFQHHECPRLPPAVAKSASMSTCPIPAQRQGRTHCRARKQRAPRPSRGSLGPRIRTVPTGQRRRTSAAASQSFSSALAERTSRAASQTSKPRRRLPPSASWCNTPCGGGGRPVALGHGFVATAAPRTGGLPGSRRGAGGGEAGTERRADG
mmetsp:Transcript_112385/g.324652  ORF Transcript_112385/g.324652 Transcript_112385/m.324652 type:complete len:255 (+) Transcript_112385:896-1660(+)